MNSTLQLRLIHIVGVFSGFGREMDFLSKHLSNEMVETLERTWSESITASFSQTIQEELVVES